jgi:hypothetical protein
MLILASPSDLLRVITSAAADIEVHASWVDYTAPSTVAPDSLITPSIVTATTTTVSGTVPASTKRNVKHLNITNNHASVSCAVTVDHTNGTNTAELMSFVLLPGENMTFNEEGRWVHHDAQGAEYPPAGLGAYTGYGVQFMKSASAPDAVGYWYCTSKDSGFPGAWSPGTPGINGRNTDGTSAADFGCLPIRNPASGATFLTNLMMNASIPHGHVYFDVLWVNSGLVVTTTTAQAITQPTLPPRDLNGASDGLGCMIGLLVTAAAGLVAVSSAATVSYTNSEGTAGRTATLSAIVGSQAPATPVIGTLIWFNLQAGDRGVRSIQSITLGITWVSGSISLFVARQVATIGTPQAYVPVNRPMPDPGTRLYNNNCILHCYLASSITQTFFAGELTIMEK